MNHIIEEKLLWRNVVFFCLATIQRRLTMKLISCLENFVFFVFADTNAIKAYRGNLGASLISSVDVFSWICNLTDHQCFIATLFAIPPTTFSCRDVDYSYSLGAKAVVTYSLRIKCCIELYLHSMESLSLTSSWHLFLVNVQRFPTPWKRNKREKRREDLLHWWAHLHLCVLCCLCCACKNASNVKYVTAP